MTAIFATGGEALKPYSFTSFKSSADVQPRGGVGSSFSAFR
eukprot:CAMPEP_0197414400 /NCGR_PEP_ID=MMETSP1170-20131217/1119_1 /TAXON_ID=54406 /ORGANISM="Sarcinochrysis sp, Strain CCMP770" /LENGTH=40 /DNA_ID= /DNA_START= /DNA_END= /DNA_ORIENTATION=